MEIRGTAVAELQRLLFAAWKEQKGDPVRNANCFPALPREGVQTIRIIGEHTAAQVETLLQADIAASAPVSLHDWSTRPLGEQFEELKARLWLYWM
jgi:hypothetical protein